MSRPKRCLTRPVIPGSGWEVLEDRRTPTSPGSLVAATFDRDSIATELNLVPFVATVPQDSTLVVEVDAGDITSANDSPTTTSTDSTSVADIPVVVVAVDLPVGDDVLSGPITVVDPDPVPTPVTDTTQVDIGLSTPVVDVNVEPVADSPSNSSTDATGSPTTSTSTAPLTETTDSTKAPLTSSDSTTSSTTSPAPSTDSSVPTSDAATLPASGTTTSPIAVSTPVITVDIPDVVVVDVSPVVVVVTPSQDSPSSPTGTDSSSTAVVSPSTSPVAGTGTGTSATDPPASVVSQTSSPSTPTSVTVTSTPATVIVGTTESTASGSTLVSKPAGGTSTSAAATTETPASVVHPGSAVTVADHSVASVVAAVRGTPMILTATPVGTGFGSLAAVFSGTLSQSSTTSLPSSVVPSSGSMYSVEANASGGQVLGLVAWSVIPRLEPSALASGGAPLLLDLLSPSTGIDLARAGLQLALDEVSTGLPAAGLEALGLDFDSTFAMLRAALDVAPTAGANASELIRDLDLLVGSLRGGSVGRLVQLAAFSPWTWVALGAVLVVSAELLRREMRNASEAPPTDGEPDLLIPWGIP